MRPDIAMRYRHAARAITAEITAERPEIKDYTLDLALDKDGQVVIVELNPMTNYGLYAADVDQIVTALRRKVLENG